MEKEINLMYSSEAKDEFIVFDDTHRFIGTADPDDIYHESILVDEKRDKAIIREENLNRIIHSKELYLKRCDC